MAFISFIIPAYNAENTIKRCVDSILLVKNAKFEIIIINDGSVDKTEAICKKYKKNHANVFVYTQENSGVSVARNNGILKAKGDFISFVDADDFIVADEMQKVIKSINKDDELLMYNFVRHKNDAIIKDSLKLSAGVYDKEGFIKLSECMLDYPIYKNWENSIMQGSSVQYLYKKNLLISNNIYFDTKLVYAEDLCFCLEVFKKFSKIKITDFYAYTIVTYQGSASKRYRENFWDELKNTLNRILVVMGYEPPNSYYHYGKAAFFHFIHNAPYNVARKKCLQILNDVKFKKSVEQISFNNKTILERMYDWCFLQSFFTPIYITVKLHLLCYALYRKMQFYKK